MPSPADWQRCFADFLQSLRNKSGSAAAATHYRGYLLRFFGDFSRSPASYSRAEVEAFVNAPSFGSIRHGQPVGAATKHQRLAALRSFYTYAAQYTYPDEAGAPQPILTSAPPTLSIPTPKRASAPRGLSDDELRRLFAAIPTETLRGKRDRAVLLTYFWSARRRSEIVRLKRSDFSPASFPGGRAGWTYRFTGKGTAGADDRAEMPGPAMAAIFAYLEADGRDWQQMAPDEPILLALPPSQSGDTRYRTPRALGSYGCYEIVKKYARLAGLRADIGLHSLRHTAARLRYETTHDVLHVHDLLRHRSLDVTWRYVQQLVGTEDPVAKLLEAQYGGL